MDRPPLVFTQPHLTLTLRCASAAARGNVNSSGASGGTQMLSCSLSLSFLLEKICLFFSQFLQISRQTSLVCVCANGIYSMWVLVFWGTITKHYMACCNQLLTLQNDSFIHVQISIDFFFGELFNLTGKILKV